MLYSKMYSKYFPVTECHTRFSAEDIKTLCRWVSIFKTEVEAYEWKQREKGYRRIQSYELSNFNEDEMKQMLKKNRFNDLYLKMLNIILYRHKYNVAISFFIFPVLSEKEYTRILSDEIRKKEILDAPLSDLVNKKLQDMPTSKNVDLEIEELKKKYDMKN